MVTPVDARVKNVEMTSSSLTPHAEEGTEIERNQTSPSPRPPFDSHLDDSNPWFQSYSQPPPPPRAADPPPTARRNLQRYKTDPQKLETEYAQDGFDPRKNASPASAVSASASALSSSQQEHHQDAVFHHNQVTRNQHLFNHSNELQRGRTSLDTPIYFPLSGHENNINLHLATMSSQPSHRLHQPSSVYTLPRYDLPPQDGLRLLHSHAYQQPLTLGVTYNMTDKSVSPAEPSYQSIHQPFNFVDDVRTHRGPPNNNNAACMNQSFLASKLAETGRYCNLPYLSMPQNSSLAMMDSRIGVKSASSGLVISCSTEYQHSLTTPANHIHESESPLEPVHLPVATEEKQNFLFNNISSTSKIDRGLVQTKPNIMRGKYFSSSNPHAVLGGPVKKNMKKAINKKRKGSHFSVPNTSADEGSFTMKPIHTMNENGVVDGFSSFIFASQTHPTMQMEHAAYKEMCERWWNMASEDKQPCTEMAFREMERYQRTNPAIDQSCTVPATHDLRRSIVPINLGNGSLPATTAFTENTLSKNSALGPDLTYRTQGVALSCNTNTSARQSAFAHRMAWEGMSLSEDARKQRFGNESDLMQRLKMYAAEPRNSSEQSLWSSTASHADVKAGGYSEEKYVANDVAMSDAVSSIRPLEKSPQSTEFISSEVYRTGVACIDDCKAPFLRQPTSNLPSQKKSSDGFLQEVDENGAKMKASQNLGDLQNTEAGSWNHIDGLGDLDQSEAKNSFMEIKTAEVILINGEDKVVDGDGEKISQKNVMGMTERKNKRHVENVELVSKKRDKREKIEKGLEVFHPRKPRMPPSQEEMSAQTSQLNIGEMTTLNKPLSFSLMSSEDIMLIDTSQTRGVGPAQINQSAVHNTIMSQVPPIPLLQPSVEAMSAHSPPRRSAWEGIKLSVLKDACKQRKLMLVGNKADLVKRLQNHVTEHGDTAELLSSSSAASYGVDRAYSAIVCARQENVSNGVATSDAVSSIRPLEKSPNTPEFRSSEGSAMITSNVPLSIPLTSVSADTNQSKVITLVFHCPKCATDFCYTKPNTAAASFSNHVKWCKREIGKTPKRNRTQNAVVKLKDSSPSSSNFNHKNGVFKRAKSTRHQPQPTRTIRGRSMLSSIPSETGFVGVKKDKQALRTKSKLSSMKEKKPFVQMPRRDKKPHLREKAAFEEKGTKLINLKSGLTEGVDGECARPSSKKDEDTPSTLFRVETTNIIAQSSYPYAPMGHLWLDKSLSSTQSRYCEAIVGHSNVGSASTLIGRRWVWDEGHFVDGHLDPQTRKKKSGCTCGLNHLFSLLNTKKKLKPSNDTKSPGGVRRSERSTYSSSVMAQLADGQLDPHTLITCEEYDLGPDYRFMNDPQTKNAQPFSVRVNPDATFLADLHAHLCDSEIIGLLGGYYSKEEKCIYIQAAFPCKSTHRIDSGSTDVEMDPVFQMYATEAIGNHGMRVVGWYHSHPDFQPNPSITDIENQANYQQLFQGGDMTERNAEEACPFVGLIVGTYDSKNPGSQSVMRWFHVQRRETAECKSVNFPMNLKTTDRHYRKMNFDNRSIADNIRRSMTLRSSKIRQILESRHLPCPLSGLPDSQTKNVTEICIYQHSANFLAVEENSGNDDCIEQPETSKESYRIWTSEDKNQNHNVIQCCSLLETGESPILLSKALYNQAPETDRIQQFKLACPLYFTDNERSVFSIGQDTVPCDVFAGIIWFAVEREQLNKSDLNEHLLAPPHSPASSRSILDLLLRQSLSLSNMLDRKLYDIIHCLDDAGLFHQSVQLDGNDAAILHSLDAVLGHYAPNLNRINPFSSWSGACDKGNIIKDYGSDPWVDFYLTKILKVEAVQTDEGPVYKGGVKMKRGHKIAACLLRWARNMQLSFNDEFDKRDRYPVNNTRDCAMSFDHEQQLNDLPGTSAAKVSYQERHYIYFVSEVMRLMVARWRECGASPAVQQGVTSK